MALPQSGKWQLLTKWFGEPAPLTIIECDFLNRIGSVCKGTTKALLNTLQITGMDTFHAHFSVAGAIGTFDATYDLDDGKLSLEFYGSVTTSATAVPAAEAARADNDSDPVDPSPPVTILGEWADTFDAIARRNEENLKRSVHQLLREHPDCWLAVPLIERWRTDYRSTVMAAQGMVDVLRLGEGVRDGGWGYLWDGLRIAQLVFPPLRGVRNATGTARIAAPAVAEAQAAARPGAAAVTAATVPSTKRVAQQMKAVGDASRTETKAFQAVLAPAETGMRPARLLLCGGGRRAAQRLPAVRPGVPQGFGRLPHFLIDDQARSLPMCAWVATLQAIKCLRWTARCTLDDLLRLAHDVPYLRVLPAELAPALQRIGIAMRALPHSGVPEEVMILARQFPGKPILFWVKGGKRAHAMVAYCHPRYGVMIIDRSGWCARSVTNFLRLYEIENATLREAFVLMEANVEILTHSQNFFAILSVPLALTAAAVQIREDQEVNRQLR